MDVSFYALHFLTRRHVLDYPPLQQFHTPCLQSGLTFGSPLLFSQSLRLFLRPHLLSAVCVHIAGLLFA